ncbi:MAG: catechol 2,3-dioxygenase-like lactoylglutathione lyase family enzyme [Halocynthiibacter sp.]|jgi:catechol 2,3-dioxygenase-like lactoylglutathione lyase family enzyme
MSFTLDHIAIACTDLAPAREWLEHVLGAPMQPRGEHSAMGTHNHLISLGPDLYLELIAVDPEAVAPDQPRWFDLDNFAGMARLSNWIARVDDLDAALEMAPRGAGAPMALSRGDYRWRMAVPADGKLPFDGGFPALIEWQSALPAPDLPDHGLRLETLYISHPRAEALQAALQKMGDPGIDIHIARGANPALGCEISTPSGMRVF